MRPVLANLGFILQINGVPLVGPIVLGFYLDQSRALNAFFVTAIVSFVSGFALNAPCERRELNFKQSCELLFASYFCLSLVGSIPYFYLNVFRTEDWMLRFTNSFFESVSKRAQAWMAQRTHANEMPSLGFGM